MMKVIVLILMGVSLNASAGEKLQKLAIGKTSVSKQGANCNIEAKACRAKGGFPRELAGVCLCEDQHGIDCDT